MRTRRIYIFTLVASSAVLLALVLVMAVAVQAARFRNANQGSPNLILNSSSGIGQPHFKTTSLSYTSELTFTPAFTSYLPVLFRNYVDCSRMARMEADYILACQYMTQDDAYGAINNVYGDPTWVVPSENAMAILGLIMASEILNDPSYMQRAQLAADYLIRVQQPDGAWCNQYNYAAYVDASKPPRQTAEVMIALYKLGYLHDRYNAMKEGAQYLMECQEIENKGGVIDDGLLGGGKDINGVHRTWRWAHDNAYAYWALKAAETWAYIEGDTSFAADCNESAQRIIGGIDDFLYDPGTGVWHIAINEMGEPQWLSNLEGLPSWIQYAPQMLDLPAEGVNSLEVGNWIHDTFQQADGSCIGYEWEAGQVHTRKYPGLSFQASLCWFDTDQVSYAEAAIQWAENSGLWQTTPDANTITGGWVDWVEIEPEPGEEANWWERFVDTSFYAIASCRRGYDFTIP